MFDTLIHNARVIAGTDRFESLRNAMVAVVGGKIAMVRAREPQEPLPKAFETVDAAGGIVLPGLVNAHTHLPMVLFRGLADDLPHDRWLNEHIFPAEAQHLRKESVRTGTLLACAEMLLSGTTTCADGYFFEEAVSEGVRQAGLRGVLGQGVIDFPAPGVPDPSRNVSAAVEFVEAWNGVDPRIRPSIFCHSPYTCSAETLQRAKEAARRLGVIFQIHLAETRDEAEGLRRRHGVSPATYLDRLGILDNDTLLVHGVWLGPEDLELLAMRGSKVVHCPESNMKLGAGIAPVPQMIAAGVCVGLGTDGCASNNDLDLFSEMDTAAKLHKVHSLDPTVMDARQVLRMATIDGARALGMADRIGSLEPGKEADLVVLSAFSPHLIPVYEPVSHAVYCARGSDVRDMMVAGRFLVRNRQLLSMDLQEVMDRAILLGRQISRQQGRKEEGEKDR